MKKFIAIVFCLLLFLSGCVHQEESSSPINKPLPSYVSREEKEPRKSYLAVVECDENSPLSSGGRNARLIVSGDSDSPFSISTQGLHLHPGQKIKSITRVDF